jgi:hypothetical protein
MIYGIAETDSNVIKIGYTHTRGEAVVVRDAMVRLSTLQCGNHRTLVLIAASSGTRDDEQSLHARFASYRISGEWFTNAGPVRDWAHANSIELNVRSTRRRWACLACTKAMAACRCGSASLPSRF